MKDMKELKSETITFLGNVDSIKLKDGKITVQMSTMSDKVDLSKLSYMTKTGVKVIMASNQTKLPLKEKK